MHDSEQPVTRAEFHTELNKISVKLDELFKAKQVSWPLIIAILSLALGVLGAGIKNWADLLTVKESSQNLIISNDDLRSRMRGAETEIDADRVENETQNRWMADILNSELQHLETLLRIKHPEIPSRDYWPLQGIGLAAPTHGGQ